MFPNLPPPLLHYRPSIPRLLLSYPFTPAGKGRGEGNPEANPEPQPTDTTVVEKPPVQPEVPPSQPSTNWSIGLWWLAVLGSGLLTLYLWLRLRKSRQMPELPTALHWQQDSEVYFDPAEVGGAMPAWLDDATLDYCADSIGFYVAEDESRWLDVPATIKASAQAAGLPEVRMQSQRSLFQILVLVDVTAPEQRWCPLAYELVAGLRQRGLPVTLGYLHGSLREFRTDEGELIRLEELAEERGRYVTLVFADARQADWQQDKLLLEELALWPQLAWLTVREPRFWNGRERRLQAAGIRLWTAEPANLIPVFRELAGEMVQTTLHQPAYQRFMQRGAQEPLAGMCNACWVMPCHWRE
ncbi:hypothetical protein [Candidatus Thiothrix anitrata]|uniref:Uncharacterized protein n=1 Tax=Candidatus Thiothrix anitrata TaxID=2823902 RepID=A0ABX7X7U9_9GAMM|nr:hypothetical protein [Candidatus Thiothrix anitrata]QTR49755.1 hypothetical protein J8380_16235 [Candidatus Thiothrix anitrata]